MRRRKLSWSPMPLFLGAAAAVVGCSSSAATTSGDGGKCVLPDGGHTSADTGSTGKEGGLHENDGASDTGSTSVGAITVGAPTTDIEVVTGATTNVPITVTRAGGASGDLSITVAGLPSGVTAAPLVIPESETSGTLVLAATAGAAQGGPAMVSLSGSLGADSAKTMASVYVRGAPGSIDMTFGTSGIYFSASSTLVEAAALDANGNLVFGGEVRAASGLSSTQWFTRVDDAFKTDTTFGMNGVVTVDFGTGAYQFVDALYVLSSGDILDLGAGFNENFTSFPLLAAELTPAGAPDTSFDTTGQSMLTFPGTPTEVGSDIDGFALQSNGDIVAFGGIPSEGGGPEIFARLTPTGTADGTFGTSGILEPAGSTGEAVCGGVQSDGNIVSGGYSEASMVASWQVERVTTAGVIDTTYGTNGFTSTSLGGNAYIDSCQVDANDNLVVVGTVTGGPESGFVFGRYTKAGVLDPTFNHGLPLQVGLGTTSSTVVAPYPTTLLIDAAGGVVAVGSSPMGAVTVVRVTPDGLLDPTFGQDGVFANAGGVTQTPGKAYSAAHGVIDSRQRVIVVGTGMNGTTLGIFAVRVWL